MSFAISSRFMKPQNGRASSSGYRHQTSRGKPIFLARDKRALDNGSSKMRTSNNGLKAPAVPYGVLAYPGQAKQSFLVNHLGSQFSHENIGVVCAYLNYREHETQSPSNILAGLWRRLMIKKDMPPGSTAYNLYKQHHEQRTRPSLDEIDSVLRSVITQYAKVYIILDALDEYLESHPYVLLERLAQQGPTASLMLTFRPHITPTISLPSTQELEIRAVTEDIHRYVDSEIQTSFRLSRHVQTRPELRKEIEDRIVDSADGMFLLAKLQIDSLSTKSTVRAVRDALQNLTKDLEHTYEEALDRIEAQNEDDRNIAWQTISWVSNAKRPLYLSELREALAIEPNATGARCG
ncbi:hypothetical protein DFH09DRAFT_1087863 [Mycena vulgaris]|nr:hypothetical protein DFH09DRAFT_1087863 [Mycena vulgaris]